MRPRKERKESCWRLTLQTLLSVFDGGWSHYSYWHQQTIRRLRGKNDCNSLTVPGSETETLLLLAWRFNGLSYRSTRGKKKITVGWFWSTVILIRIDQAVEIVMHVHRKKLKLPITCSDRTHYPQPSSTSRGVLALSTLIHMTLTSKRARWPIMSARITATACPCKRGATTFSTARARRTRRDATTSSVQAFTAAGEFWIFFFS